MQSRCTDVESVAALSCLGDDIISLWSLWKLPVTKTAWLGASLRSLSHRLHIQQRFCIVFLYDAEVFHGMKGWGGEGGLFSVLASSRQQEEAQTGAAASRSVVWYLEQQFEGGRNETQPRCCCSKRRGVVVGEVKLFLVPGAENKSRTAC